MKSLLAGLLGLGPARLAALAVVGAGTLGLLLFLALHMTADAPMALLYGDLDLREAGAMADLLDKAHVAHRLDNGGGSIFVPADQVAQARLDLARDGLPSGGSIGYEIFDKGDSLTASQFQQGINQTRALEGELSRSIRMIHGVRQVRVHLVLARREPFAQEQQPAQASVLLGMVGAARMDHEGVQAVLNLVSAAVPGLKSQNIGIIDDRGEVLARAGQPTDGDAAVATQDDLRHATEARLSHAVEDLLERSLGAGHVRAEVSVDMDFDQTHRTEQSFNPDQQVTRSSQTVTDSSRSTEKDASVSVQNNLPNPDPTGPGSGSSDQRQEETTNYEIGTTTTTVVHDQPQIRRVSLAVMVDGTTTTTGAGGKPQWQERGKPELDRLAALARTAIGFDARRGDTIEIASMRFADAEADVPQDGGGLPLGLTKADLMHLAQSALLGLVMLAAVLMVLRPAAIRLTAARALVADMAPAEAGLLADGTAAALLTDESMVKLAQVDGQVRASSLRGIADLVVQHPAQSVAIMRGWMVQEAG